MINLSKTFHKIVDRNHTRTGLKYQIMWQFQNTYFTSWEPLQNLINHIDAVKQYERDLKYHNGHDSIGSDQEQNKNHINQKQNKQQSQQMVKFAIVISLIEQNKGHAEKQKQDDKINIEQGQECLNQIMEDNGEMGQPNIIRISLTPLLRKQKCKNRKRKQKRQKLIRINSQKISQEQIDHNPVSRLMQKKCWKQINFDELYQRQNQIIRLQTLNPVCRQSEIKKIYQRKLKILCSDTFQDLNIRSQILCLWSSKFEIKQVFKNQQTWYAIVIEENSGGIYLAQDISEKYPQNMRIYLGNLMEELNL